MSVCYRARRHAHPWAISPFTPIGQFGHGGQSILSMKLAACVGNSAPLTNTLRVSWQKYFSSCEVILVIGYRRGHTSGGRAQILAMPQCELTVLYVSRRISLLLPKHQNRNPGGEMPIGKSVLSQDLVVCGTLCLSKSPHRKQVGARRIDICPRFSLSAEEMRPPQPRPSRSTARTGKPPT